MNLFRRSTICILSAGLLALAGCAERLGNGGAADDQPDIPEAERYGGTAVLTVSADIDDVNPLTLTSADARDVGLYLLFMPLLQYDEKLEPEPYEARSWEVNADTTLLTFHLRDDVYWHDGVKTTAYDWKFSYDLARDPKTGFPNSAIFTHYGDAEAVDSFTFRVKMQPHADFLSTWRVFEAVPEHLLKDVRPEEMRKHPFGTTQPIGNGPFRFVSRAPGASWTFAANPSFPRELGGRPYLDRVVFRVIPEQTTSLTELLTGRVHMALIPSEQRAQVQAAGNVRLLPYDMPGYTYIVWNERKPLFRDPRVRRALTMAIDRQGIIDGILYGDSKLANSTVSPMLWNYDPQAGAELRYDTAAARRLLAEAGWSDRDHDGVLEDAQGREFRFTLKTNKGNQQRADMLEKIQSDLKKMGIRADAQLVEFGTMTAQARSRDFDAMLSGWSTPFKIDDTDIFHCKKMDRPFQYSGLCDPEVDRLLDTLPKVVDRAAAMPLWRQYQRRIAELQPYTLLFYLHRVSGVSDLLRDVHPDARGGWVDIRKWWLLPAGRAKSTTS